MDALKYIPFNTNGDIYLTLSGNFRQHNFYDQRAGFGSTKKEPAYRNNFRWNAGADLHLGEHVRLYGELMSGQAAGINYYAMPGAAGAADWMHNRLLWKCAAGCLTPPWAAWPGA